MSYRVVGTCSLCGGSVCVPNIWSGVQPPTPTCTQCNAVPVQAHGPVMPMQPRRGVEAWSGPGYQQGVRRG